MDEVPTKSDEEFLSSTMKSTSRRSFLGYSCPNSAVDPRVPSARVYGAYVNPDAADLLRQAPTEGEYYVGLEYF
jgi:hypothetical protein